MKHLTSLFALAVAALAIVGCNDTAAGMAEDTSENAEAVAEGSERAAEAAENAADNVGEATADVAATTLTARIKSAYVANPILNEDNVKIDVDSSAEQVVLKGYVATKEQHEMAVSIAQKVIEEAGDDQKLIDNLTMQE